MASYVSSWLNDTVHLSVSIKNPGKQFSNGYLFGELLVALNWLDQSEYIEMVDRGTTEARLSNFEVVHRCLSSHGVLYDNNLIPLIVTEARGGE